MSEAVCCKNCVWSELFNDEIPGRPDSITYECRHRYNVSAYFRHYFKEKDWCSEFELRGVNNLNRAGNK